MLSTLPESTMHRVRWVLTIGWCLLIVSLFYDPVSAWFTEPSTVGSPLRIDLQDCVEVQGQCLEEIPYALGAPLFWGIIVPSAIFILLVLGHEFWRRICPLSFLSQIPRALGWQRKRKRQDPKTGKIRYELFKVGKESWLNYNHTNLQLGLFFVGLCCRILFVNSNRIALGLFLILTIIAAITVGYLYGGKSWCQYFCPMAPVQKIYSEPRGLLNSKAHEGASRAVITQSMCRAVGQDGKELSACVACQSPCIDIDAERSYWDGLKDPQQQRLYYSYLGLVVGYFIYYYLYSGNWDYYLSGAWAHEENQLANLLSPGFYLFSQPIPIPKLLAVPMTLMTFMVGGYQLGRTLENRYNAHRPPQSDPILVRHHLFTLCTFLAFNFFFIFAGHNFIQLLPNPLPSVFSVLIAICSTLWLYRTWQRNPGLYEREGLAHRLRKQLKKLDLETEKFLDGRSLDELSASEVYVLAKVLPSFSHEKRLQAYQEVLRETIKQDYLLPENSLDRFKQLRQDLSISEEEHHTILQELEQQHPEIFNAARPSSQEDALRLESYREMLLETILSSWKNHPEKAKIMDLLTGFSENASPEALERILNELSASDHDLVEEIRQEYSITADEESDVLMRTDPVHLWQILAERIGVKGSIDIADDDYLYPVFQQIDSDGSGHISFDELKTYMRVFDPNLTGAQIKEMLIRADSTSDRHVSYEEFKAVFQSLKPRSKRLGRRGSKG